MNIRFFLSVLVLLGSLNYSIVFAQNSNNNIKAVKGLETFAAAYKYLDMMYVDTLDAEQVINTGIRAMVGSLDPYTIYYTQKEKKRFRDNAYRKICRHRVYNKIQSCYKKTL